MLTAPLTIRQSAGPPAAPIDAETVRRTGTAAGRLVWLDVLRGLAALIVALHHASDYYVPGWKAEMVDWLDPGKYGVLVFFLVSGYVIPASLERRGSLRGFWIGRLFRIYPLLLVICLAGLLPYLLGIRGLRAGLGAFDPVVAILAHLTMLQDLLGVPNMLNVLWTLSYEMVFYLLVAGLFVTGTHRRSAATATLLAVAVVSVSAVLPASGLSRALGIGPVVFVTTTVLVLAIGACLSGRRRLATAGGALGGVLGALLVTANGRVSAWEGLSYLALMFAGTAFYRFETAWRTLRAQRATAGAPAQGSTAAGRRKALLGVAAGLGAFVAVLSATIAAGAWNAYTYLNGAASGRYTLSWSVSMLLAAGTFVIAWLLRRFRMPRMLGTLGQISFSVYLLHPVLLIYSDQFLGTSGKNEPLLLAIFVVVLLAVSLLTYRLIEEPSQRLGRRLAGRQRPRLVRAIDHGADSQQQHGATASPKSG